MSENQVCLSNVDDTTSYLIPQQLNTLIQVKGIDKLKMKPWQNSRKEYRQSWVKALESDKSVFESWLCPLKAVCY